MAQLEMKIIRGKKNKYLFVRCSDGSYVTFAAGVAKEAAQDCRATQGGGTRQMCKKVWDAH